MKDTAIVIILWLFFASSHMLLSSRMIRPRLVARLGNARFVGAYSLVSILSFTPLVYFYLTHRHAGPQLWPAPESGAVEAVLVLVNVIGFVLLTAGIMTQALKSSSETPRDEPIGVQRITRHAVFMGIGVWALAHLLITGWASDAAFFGGFIVFVLVGSWHQDQRRLADGDAQFKRFHAATVFLPFTGPGRLRGVMELPPVAVIIGVVVALLARYLHPSIGA